MPISILAKEEYWHLDQVTQGSSEMKNFPPQPNPHSPTKENPSWLAPSSLRRGTTESGKREAHTGPGLGLETGGGKAELLCSSFVSHGNEHFGFLSNKGYKYKFNMI